MVGTNWVMHVILCSKIIKKIGNLPEPRNPMRMKVTCTGLYKIYHIQGCLANPDAANSDDSANSDGFLRKNLKLFFVIFLLFFQFFTAKTEF